MRELKVEVSASRFQEICELAVEASRNPVLGMSERKVEVKAFESPAHATAEGFQGMLLLKHIRDANQVLQRCMFF